MIRRLGQALSWRSAPAARRDPTSTDGASPVRSREGLDPTYALALAILLLPAAASAQDAPWPTGTVRIVVPFPPGGGADGLPRVLTESLSRLWGQPVIIENKAGAGGNLGAELVARAAPDGYTLLSAPTPVYAINQSLYKKLNYDPSSLKPIVLLGQAASALAVHPSVGVTSVKELIAKAKAEPGIAYGSQGNGTTTHLTAAMFEAAVGVKLNHVPYRGSGPLMNDLVGGHIKLSFDNLASVLTQHRAGKVLILAVCSPERSQFIPEMPTMIEAGVPGFVSVAWFAMSAPAGTPDAIVNKINKDVVSLLADPDTQKKYAALGAEVLGKSPADMATLVAAERKRWADVIKSANVPLVE